jgi:hypothetical protein
LKPIHAPQAHSHHGGAHDPEDQRGDGQPHQHPDEDALGGVGRPQLPGHAVEAEALFEPEGGVQLEGQVEQAGEDRERGEQGELVGEGAVGRVDGAVHGVVQGVEPAEQGPPEQDGRAPCRGQQAEPPLRDGVVGRLAVRGQRHRARERGGHGVTVREHVPHLP